MSPTNYVSFEISSEAMERIKEGINLITENLPKLVNLSPEQRQIIPKMGDKTLSFVKKALEYVEQNPDIVPKYFNIEEFKKDITVSDQLFQIIIPLQKLIESLEDTSMMAGSEAYTAALVFYSALKNAIAAGETGLKNIYEDLSARFPGRSYKTIKKASV